MIWVLIVEDDHFAAEGLRERFADEPDLKVVGIAKNGKTALEIMAALQPDVLVLDCKLPDISGPEVVAEIDARGWHTHVLAFSAYDNPEMIEAMIKAGALGYFVKGDKPEHMIAAVRAVAQGETWFSQSIGKWVYGKLSEIGLTPRQKEILWLVEEGMTDQQIAQTMQVSEKVVEANIVRILKKLYTNNRTQAVSFAKDRGWL
jgi:DNA-binding NarL/FixJ family response regulator